MLTLRLLGGFALLDDAGAPAGQLSQRRAEAVLALLALCGDVGCTRDRLVGLLWPESDTDRARHSLRSALHVIRAAIGQESVLASGDQLRLNGALVSSDIDVFARAMRDGRLEAAVAAYGGALLAGFHVDDAPEFERFIEEERVRLYRKCAEAIETLARDAERASGPHGGVAWWSRAAEHDPHNSRVAIHLMRALVAAGDPANALLQGDLHRRRLAKDLEIEPDAQFEAEVKRIRTLCVGRAANNKNTHAAIPSHAADIPVHSASHADAAGAGPGGGGPAPPALAAADNGVGTPAAAVPVAEPARRSRSKWLVSFAVLVVIAGVATSAWWWTRDRADVALDPDRVAIVPFASSGHATLESTAADLRALVVRELLEGPAPNAVEPSLVDHAWASASALGLADPLATDAEVARRTGASLVLRGVVDSTADGHVLTLTLSRFPAHRVEVRRSVPLARSDESARVRRLLIEVLALEAGEPEHRLATLSGHSIAAVRRYFEYVRRQPSSKECHGMVRDAWRWDSTLVYPGLVCLELDGFMVGNYAWLDTVARETWRRRSGLPAQDSAFVEALVGPWFGRADNAEQRIALWRGAVTAAPQWWVPWAALARELALLGPRTTLKEWRRDAERANARALELSQWSQLGPVEMAFWFGIFRGDSAWSRRAMTASARFDLVEPQRNHDATSYYWWGTRPWPWLYDAAFGDGRLVLPVGVPLDSLIPRVRLLSVLAQARPGTNRYLDTLLLRWERQPGFTGRGFLDYWIAAYWNTRGDYQRWLAARKRMNDRRFRSEWPEYDGIAEDAHEGFWEVLHHGAPEDTVFRLRLARMERVLANDSQPAPPPGVRGIAACWVTLWRLSHGDTTRVGQAIRILRDLEARDRSGELDGLPDAGRWVRCPALLEAHRARVTGKGALEAARAYDRLLQPLPVPRRGWWFFVTSTKDDGVAVYNESLDAAWLLAAAGDTVGALAAVRRRPRWAALMLDFHFTPTQHLRLEGRLAAAATDTLGAIAAYEGYLALRPTPPAHPPWRAEWDSVQAELARMKKLRP